MPKLLADPEYPNLKQHPKSGTYYLRKYSTEKKEELLISLREKNRNKAIRKMNQELARWMAHKKLGPEVLVNEVIDELLEIYQMKAQATFEDFEIHTRIYIRPYFNGWTLPIMAKAVAKFAADTKKAYPDIKLGHIIKHTHRILNHAVHRGYIESFNRYRLDANETTPEPGREYSNEEIKLILEGCDDTHRLKTIILLSTGMRPGEVNCLKYEYIDFKTGHITLPAEIVKTRYGRRYPIDQRVVGLLEERRAESKSAYVFPHKFIPNQPMAKSQRGWHRIEERIAIRLAKESGQEWDGKTKPIKVRPHWFRHTFATRARRAGFGDGEITKNLGMSQQVLNRVYVHPSEEDKSRMSSAVGDTMPVLQIGMTKGK